MADDDLDPSPVTRDASFTAGTSQGTHVPASPSGQHHVGGGSQSASPPPAMQRSHRGRLAWSVSLNERGTVAELETVAEPSAEVRRVLDAALDRAESFKGDRRWSGFGRGREAVGARPDHAASGVADDLIIRNPLGHEDLRLLLSSRGAEFDAVVSAADRVRRLLAGDEVTYVVNRNINYTNVCTYKWARGRGRFMGSEQKSRGGDPTLNFSTGTVFMQPLIDDKNRYLFGGLIGGVYPRRIQIFCNNHNIFHPESLRCQFCAFSKGKAEEQLRGSAYVVPLEEISRRAAEAWAHGATEVCMQVRFGPGMGLGGW